MKQISIQKTALVLAIIVALFAIWQVAKKQQAPQTQNPSPQTSTEYHTDTPTKTSGCKAAGGLPDHLCTPGALNPQVTQSAISTTICVQGYTKTIRPPVTYTDNLKKQQIAEYGLPLATKDYEEDHLIALELGGNPTDPANLWPEAYLPVPGAHEKDHVENYLHKQVCSGAMTLAEAQKEIDTNWEEVYKSVSNITNY